MSDVNNDQFIPAKESVWFIFLFDLYVRNLFKRRFESVRIKQEYQPSPTSRTIYYLNHTTWWDGLIPLLLNRKIFRQNARAMMEDTQMKKHKLFRKIGAFSVNLVNPRSAVRSLRYAVDSMKRPNSSLFIYPEGEIKPFKTNDLHFREGLAWIAGRLPEVDIVPVGIYLHSASSDKPELFLKVGSPVEFNPDENRETLRAKFEYRLESVLTELQIDSHSDPHSFEEI